MSGGIHSKVEGFHFERHANEPTKCFVALRTDGIVDVLVGVRVQAGRVRTLPPRLRRAITEFGAAVMEHAARTNNLGGVDGPLRGVIDVVVKDET